MCVDSTLMTEPVAGLGFEKKVSVVRNCPIVYDRYIYNRVWGNSICMIYLYDSTQLGIWFRDTIYWNFDAIASGYGSTLCSKV